MKERRLKRKKLMTAVYAVVFIVFLGFVFTGCGSSESDLIGRWYRIGMYSGYDGIYLRWDDLSTWEFLTDGVRRTTGVSLGEEWVRYCSWSVSGRILTIGEGYSANSATFRINDQRLYRYVGYGSYFVLSRCRYDLPSNIAAALVGTWELYDTNRPGTVSERVEFARNGSGTMRHGAIMENFTWSVEGRELIVEQAGGHLTIVYNITELTQNRLSYEADFPGTGLLRATFTRQ